jgi:AraC-like DNA-binding protein
MSPAAPFSLAVRSYGTESVVDRHAFGQLVLPLLGTLEMEVAGRGGQVRRGEAVFVEAGAKHAQISASANRSLVLDLHQMAPDIVERLAARTYLPLPPAANKLIEFMDLIAAGQTAPAVTLERWVPLLLDTVDGAISRPVSRLTALLAIVEAGPGYPWTVAAMAERAGLSVSRLHALFREELDTTPRAWLSEMRLSRVREWLGLTKLPIAELAYRGGYSDQSALTRAMRKATGLTPAAYRRQAQEPGPKEG